MLLLHSQPSTWKDLQNKVSNFLLEIGYNCEIEKDITTTRETVNIDIYATSQNKTPIHTILCECKYREKSIPKNTIHAFRTVIQDYGANHGFIISKKGFQKGTYSSIKNTNVILLKWEDFQNYFKQDWLTSKIISLMKENKPLYDYIAGFPIGFEKPIIELTKEQKKAFEILYWKYFNLAFHSKLSLINPETNTIDINYFEDYFSRVIKKEFNSNFTSYEEFFNFMFLNGEKALEEFDNLLGKKYRR